VKFLGATLLWALGAAAFLAVCGAWADYLAHHQPMG